MREPERSEGECSEEINMSIFGSAKLRLFSIVVLLDEKYFSEKGEDDLDKILKEDKGNEAGSQEEDETGSKAHSPEEESFGTPVPEDQDEFQDAKEESPPDNIGDETKAEMEKNLDKKSEEGSPV